MPSQEVHFFDNESQYSKGIDHYISKMLPSYPDQITMEKVLMIGEVFQLNVHQLPLAMLAQSGEHKTGMAEISRSILI